VETSLKKAAPFDDSIGTVTRFMPPG